MRLSKPRWHLCAWQFVAADIYAKTFHGVLVGFERFGLGSGVDAINLLSFAVNNGNRLVHL